MKKSINEFNDKPKKDIPTQSDSRSYQHPVQRRQAIDAGRGAYGADIDRNSVDIAIPAKLKSSCIGIWWLVGDELISYMDVLDGEYNAVEEGDLEGTYQLDFNKFHKDLWHSEGLAEKYDQSEFDFYPRGRIIYDVSDETFDIYTSYIFRELQALQFIARLAAAFHIPDDSYRVVTFYRSKADSFGNALR